MNDIQGNNTTKSEKYQFYQIERGFAGSSPIVSGNTLSRLDGVRDYGMSEHHAIPSAAKVANSTILRALEIMMNFMMKLLELIVNLVSGTATSISNKGTSSESSTGVNLVDNSVDVKVDDTTVQPNEITKEDSCTCSERLEKLEKAEAKRKAKEAKKARKARRAKRTKKSKGAAKLKSANVSKGGGFLWKPKSDSDGKLVILLSSSDTGNVKGVKVLSANGEILAQGKKSGVANGNREHFRFDRAGDSFPSGSLVEIEMKDGTKKKITIDNTSSRFEGR